MCCYYNHADEVELWINGVSQGVRTKPEGKFHAMWRVTYQPGEVRVVSRKEGKEILSQTIHTATEPAQIRLTPDRTTLHADGSDLSFVTVEILDKDGNLCPNADNLVTFTVEGNAFIAGVDNGSPYSMERFKANHRKAFYGKCLVVLQNNGIKGNATLTATADGLREAKIVISAQ
jgi:beta-galactosidase